MTGNSIAINPYGAYNDPYFLAAYQAPNANAMAQYQNNPYAQTQAVQYNPYAQVQAVQNNPQAVTTNPAAQPEPKKKSKAGLILGGIALTGAAILCHKRGNADLKFFQRLWDGAQQYWKAASSWVNKTLAKVGNKPMSVKEFYATGGKVNAKEKRVITKTGEYFTGSLSKKDGTILKYAEGKLVT